MLGQEPVRYVRNIYKYYVAYKLIEDADAAKKAADRRGHDGAGCGGNLPTATTRETTLTPVSTVRVVGDLVTCDICAS